MTAQIYEAIPAILAEVEHIAKNKKNQQQGYNFRGIDDVYKAVHPLLAKHKVFPTCKIVSREMTERETQKGGVLFYVNIKAEYTLWASDGSHVVTEAWGEAMDSGDKASNKAMSAAYKYALFQLLCIPTEAVDSEEDTHEPAPRRTDAKPSGKTVTPPPGMTTGDKVAPPKQKKPFADVLAATEGFDDLTKLLGLIDKKDDADVPIKMPMYRDTYLKLLALDLTREQAEKINKSITAKREVTLLDDPTYTALIVKVDAILDRKPVAA